MEFNSVVTDGKGNAVKDGKGGDVKSRGMPKKKAATETTKPKTRTKGGGKGKAKTSLQRGPAKRNGPRRSKVSMRAGPLTRGGKRKKPAQPSRRLDSKGKTPTTAEHKRAAATEARRKVTRWGVGPTNRADNSKAKPQHQGPVKRNARAYVRPKPGRAISMAVRNWWSGKGSANPTTIKRNKRTKKSK